MLKVDYAREQQQGQQQQHEQHQHQRRYTLVSVWKGTQAGYHNGSSSGSSSSAFTDGSKYSCLDVGAELG